MHPEAFEFVRKSTQRFQAVGTHVLEIGSYDVNGGIRGLFPAARFIGIDRSS